MSNIVQKPPQQQQVSPLENFRRDWAANISKLRSALPANISPEKFSSVVMTAVQTKPELLAADRQSLFVACLKCAADGLLPDNREAALIEYKGIVTYQSMIAGVMRKMRNSGEIAFVNAEVVYTGEPFEYFMDEHGKHIKHTPDFTLKRGTSENAILVYAVAKLKDGEVDYEFMNKAEVEYVRSKSKAPNSPAWRDWWGEMARKTVLRRFSKRLPMSTDTREFIQQDDDQFDLKAANSKIEELSKRLHAAEQPVAIEYQEPPVAPIEVHPDFEKACNELPDPRIVK